MQPAVGVQTARAPEEVCDKEEKVIKKRKAQKRDRDTKTKIPVCFMKTKKIEKAGKSQID